MKYAAQDKWNKPWKLVTGFRKVKPVTNHYEIYFIGMLGTMPGRNELKTMKEDKVKAVSIHEYSRHPEILFL